MAKRVSENEGFALADRFEDLAKLQTDGPHGAALTVMDEPLVTILSQIDFAQVADLLRIATADWDEHEAEELDLPNVPGHVRVTRRFAEDGQKPDPAAPFLIWREHMRLEASQSPTSTPEQVVLAASG